ncbi:MAG: Hsp20/alpha crystallin family protein [Pseudomonadota bacterium]
MASAKENIPVKVSKKQAVNPKVWPELQHPILEMERAFDRLFGRRWPTISHLIDAPEGENVIYGMRVPSLDVVDRDHEVLVRAEMPGVDKKDIDVSLNGNMLTIKGQTSKEEKEEEGEYYKHEISASSFARSVALSGDVDESKAEASLKHGVLEITLPKINGSKRRNISVK